MRQVSLNGADTASRLKSSSAPKHSENTLKNSLQPATMGCAKALLVANMVPGN
jgi:hypothetical protein